MLPGASGCSRLLRVSSDHTQILKKPTASRHTSLESVRRQRSFNHAPFIVQLRYFEAMFAQAPAPLRISDTMNRYAVVKGVARRARMLVAGVQPFGISKSLKMCRVAVGRNPCRPSQPYAGAQGIARSATQFSCWGGRR